MIIAGRWSFCKIEDISLEANGANGAFLCGARAIAIVERLLTNWRGHVNWSKIRFRDLGAVTKMLAPIACTGAFF